MNKSNIVEVFVLQRAEGSIHLIKLQHDLDGNLEAYTTLNDKISMPVYGDDLLKKITVDFNSQ